MAGEKVGISCEIPLWRPIRRISAAIVVSCCGVVCSACGHHPADCKGCPEIEGRVFWLEYTGGETCPIYACCVGEKGYAHCGKCRELPCGRYGLDDPTKSPEENAADHAKQLEQLRKMA